MADSSPFPTAPLLRLPQCVLRPYHAADAAPMQELADDPQIVRYMRDRFPHPYTAADAAFWLRIARAEGLPPAAAEAATPTPAPAPATDVHLAVCLHDGTLVGGASLSAVGADPTDRYTRELGYWIGRPFWGRGLATEVAGGFARWGLSSEAAHRMLVVAAAGGDPPPLPLQRIEAGVFAGNAASMRVLERAGFVSEGVRRAAVCKQGTVLGVHLYSLVQADLEAEAKAEPVAAAETGADDGVQVQAQSIT